MRNFLSKMNKVYVIIFNLFLLKIIPIGETHFSLYITSDEMRRILGLKTDLFYVREGVLNTYGLNWTVPVAPNVSEIYFTWYALVKKPVKYDMAVLVNQTDDHKSLLKTSLSISPSGVLPRSPKTFSLSLKCSGRVNAELDVILRINVTSHRSKDPPVRVSIKRKKICIKSAGTEMSEQHTDPINDTDVNKYLPYYVVSVVAGVTLVFFLLFAVAFCRRKKVQAKESVKISEISSTVSGLSSEDKIRTSSSSILNNSQRNYLYKIPSTYIGNSYTSFQKVLNGDYTPATTPFSSQHSQLNSYTYANPFDLKGLGSRSSLSESLSEFSKDYSEIGERGCKTLPRVRYDSAEVVLNPFIREFREKFKMLQIERQRIKITTVIHKGAYGLIYRGWIQATNRKSDQQVTMKTLQEGYSSEMEATFCREGSRLFNFFHPNVLSLLGVSFCYNVPPFLVYADTDSCNLKISLRSRKDKPLKTCEIIDFGRQAAAGLHYLHSANVIHADVAARNCLISNQNHIRITDAALAVDRFPLDYELFGASGGPRPLKWMAPELINEELFSTAGDVWSYGVLLWELVTLAQQPYENIGSVELERYLREGYRLRQPKQCPDDLYQLMAYCWAAIPADRFRTEKILAYMNSFERKLESFV